MPESAASAVTSRLSTVPDFPEKGVLFRDLTPVLADARSFAAVVDNLGDAFAGQFDAVAGVEARGFLLASAVAYRAGTGVIAVRKAGKLPGPVITERYSLEYGEAALEIEPGHVPTGCRVLILDDVLATGGSVNATARLLQRADCTIAGVGVVLELEGLGGRERVGDLRLHSILSL
ncbi:adenine phosphoribosyltransferase [Homoserinimonas sp. A447]